MLKVVNLELRFAGDITSSVEAHSREASLTLDPKLLEFLGEGRELQGTADVQEAISNWIEHQISEAEAAEMLHGEEVRKLDGLREERDARAKALYSKLLEVREMIEGTAGAGKSTQFVGLEPGLSNVDPDMLRRYGRVALETLSNPDIVPPEARVRGVGLNPQETAEDLRPVVEGLEGTLKRFRRQNRQTQEATRLKDETVDSLRLVRRHGANVVEGLLGLAGLEYHAERLREAMRRSRARSARVKTEEPASSAAKPEETSSPPENDDNVETPKTDESSGSTD